MKIGFDAKRAFNNNTGLGNYSRFILDALQRYVPEWDYLAYTPKVGKIKWNESGNIAVRTPKKGYWRALWRTYSISKQLKQEGVSIYHGLSNEIPFGLKANGIKSVVTIHDLIFLRYPSMYPLFDRLIYRVKFKLACVMADCIVAVSEQTKRDIVQFYGTDPAKIKVIYQDCDESFHRELTPEAIQKTGSTYQVSKPYILCVSTFTERKNQLTLVKSFASWKQDVYELVLVGGKGKYQSQVEDYLSQHQIQGVRIINNVSFQDLPALYQGASLFVYPSVFEGFGIPIVEALHSGIPVVAATGSCLEEAGGEACLYANPYDETDLLSKMRYLLEQESAEEKLERSRQGKMYVKRFAAAQVASNLKQLFLDIYK